MLEREDLQLQSWIVPSTDNKFHYQIGGVILCGGHGTKYPICESIPPEADKCEICRYEFEKLHDDKEQEDQDNKIYDEYLTRLENAKTQEEKRKVIASIIDDWY